MSFYKVNIRDRSYSLVVIVTVTNSMTFYNYESENREEKRGNRVNPVENAELIRAYAKLESDITGK